jgi:hypothetical protein
LDKNILGTRVLYISLIGQITSLDDLNGQNTRRLVKRRDEEGKNGVWGFGVRGCTFFFWVKGDEEEGGRRGRGKKFGVWGSEGHTVTVTVTVKIRVWLAA